MKSIINISEQQLNEIQNSSSIEFLKSLILNNIENNEEDISNESLTFVRILSQEEYDKYITNGTLNGSIVKFNIDTWHYDNNIPDNVVMYGYTQSTPYHGTYNITRELLNNNQTSLCASYIYKEFYINAIFSYFHTNYLYTYDKIIFYNKDFTQESYYIDGYYGKYTWSTHGARWCQVNTYVAFRPAFQYKDNNKSTNIYY